MSKKRRKAPEIKPETAASNEPGLLAAPLVAAVFLLWALPLNSSFWLDETATFVSVQRGFWNAIARPASWTAQSPLYGATAWLGFVIGGANEAALRIPSLLAMAGAAYALFLLAKRLFDGPTAWLAALAFGCLQQVAFAAADARPYALALFLLNGSTLALVAWMDTGRKRWAAVYCAATALVLYTHYLFALALAATAIYAWLRTRDGAVSRRALLTVWSAAAILTIPLASQMLHFYRGRGAHTFAETPRIPDLLAAFLPASLLVPVALSVLAGWLVFPRSKETPRRSKRSLELAAAWALIPPLVCFAVSIFSNTSVFVPRYFVSAAPGLALVAAWLIRKVSGPATRRVAGVGIVAGAILGFGSLRHSPEDWKGAMQAVRSMAGGTNMPVWMASGFVEASDPKALDDPELRDLLFAPLAMYPAAGDLVRLPFRLDDRTIQYVESLTPSLNGHKRFLFVGRWQGTSFEPWLRYRLASRGFRSTSIGHFGNIGVFLFSSQ